MGENWAPHQERAITIEHNNNSLSSRTLAAAWSKEEASFFWLQLTLNTCMHCWTSKGVGLEDSGSRKCFSCDGESLINRDPTSIDILRSRLTGDLITTDQYYLDSLSPLPDEEGVGGVRMEWMNGSTIYRSVVITTLHNTTNQSSVVDRTFYWLWRNRCRLAGNETRWQK